MNPLRPFTVLLLAHLALAQSTDTTLALNQSLALDTSSLSSTTFALPPSNASTSRRRTISIALCNQQDASSRTRFFATNNSAVSDPGPTSAESDVYELIVQANGIANLTLEFDGVNEAVGAGVVAVDPGSSTQAFEIGVTDVKGVFPSLSTIRCI